MHFIYLYILLYFNSLSFYIPIACQSFRYIFYVFGISLYLYFFCIPISILYIFLYLSCVHLSRLSYVFSMFQFFFGLHIMSLVYVFFIFRFYDLLHSMYYSNTSHTFVRSYSIIYFVLSYTFCTCLVLT